MFKIPCVKCEGKGIIPYYVSINGGECFDCGGSGHKEVTQEEYKAFIDNKNYRESNKENEERQIIDEYKRWFVNYPTTYFRYKDFDGTSKYEKHEIHGTRETGFYIQIGGRKFPVKAVFKRKPSSGIIYLSEWKFNFK
ncbi:hypothetical protein MOD25_05380 [Bacillus haynesii]|uniref:hypothetical protein n=1 Tax=Bacillus haynesii TaxID=1925021 RepID=UPI00227DA5A7|nr:hypothetical protein [Bacillus haynesii]MCY8549332.1 hypothetical protein [Bacillus haynesii]